ncbi:MAG: hypothetical protein ACFFAN_17500 [Promethearchaeota archaeon]
MEKFKMLKFSQDAITRIQQKANMEILEAQKKIKIIEMNDKFVIYKRKNRN